MSEETDSALGFIFTTTIAVFVLVVVLSASSANPWLIGGIAAFGSFANPLIWWTITGHWHQRAWHHLSHHER